MANCRRWTGPCAIALALAVVPTASAGWLPSRPAPGDYIADLAGWPTGGGVIAYTIDGGGTYVARLSATGRIRVRRRLAGSFEAGVLTVGPRGDIALAWEDIDPTCAQSLCSSRPVLARWPRGGTLGAPEPLAPFGENDGPDVAISASGRYFASWIDYDDGIRVVSATRFRPFEAKPGPPAFAHARTLATDLLPRGIFRVSFTGPAGWQEVVSDRRGNLGPARRVLTDRRLSGDVLTQLLSDRRGNQLATWRRPANTRELYRVARRRRGASSFGPPQSLGRSRNEFVAALGLEGRAAVLTTREDAHGHTEVLVRLRGPSGRFGHAQQLSRRGAGGAQDLALAVDGRNDVMAVWLEGVGRRSAIRAAVARRGRGFAAPRTIARLRGRNDSCNATAAASPAGGFLVLVDCIRQRPRLIPWRP